MGGAIRRDILTRFAAAPVGAVRACPPDHDVKLLVIDETIDAPVVDTRVIVHVTSGHKVDVRTDSRGEAVVRVRRGDSFWCEILDLHGMKWEAR